MHGQILKRSTSTRGWACATTLKNQKLITPALAPHAPYSVTDAGFEQVRMYAEQLEMPIHLHLHETAAEVSDAIAETSKRPIQRMKELGICPRHFRPFI